MFGLDDGGEVEVTNSVWPDVAKKLLKFPEVTQKVTATTFT